MGEGLVGVEEAIPAGEQVAIHHSHQGVLRQHLHHGAVAGQFAAVEVFGQEVRHPGLLAGFVHGLEAVGGRFIRAEEAIGPGVVADQITDQFAQGIGVFFLSAAGALHGHLVGP